MEEEIYDGYDPWEEQAQRMEKIEEEKKFKEDWKLIREHSLNKVFKRLDQALDDTENV